MIIVDDHAAIRRGVRKLLETTPYYRLVGDAPDGRSGLQVALETKPDIAIVHYSIPGLNGLNLAQALKRHMPKLEVLINTMHDLVSER